MGVSRTETNKEENGGFKITRQAGQFEDEKINRHCFSTWNIICIIAYPVVLFTEKFGSI